MLAWSSLAGHCPAQLVIDLFVEHQRCCPYMPSAAYLDGKLWQTLIFFILTFQAVFVDFQGLQTSHISRDIWYYIYQCTDSTWRKNHLDETLSIYCEKLLPYLSKAGINLSSEDIKTRILDKQLLGFTFGFLCLPIMLNPYSTMGIGKVGPTMRYLRFIKNTYRKPIKEEEHENIKEINRRMLTNIEEAFELGLIA